MSTHTACTHVPFELGDARTFAGLTVLPLFPSEEPVLEYIGLDEALARGLTVREVSEAGAVEALLVENPLGERVLLYEGEELVGAKQNRIVARSTLVDVRSQRTIPVRCVERGRWSPLAAPFEAAPRAAYPKLRRASRAGQGATWSELAAKQARMRACSPTEAAEQLYLSHRRRLDEYVEALPRCEGQSGAAVAIAGEPVCVDFVSRSDVFAGLYPKLLRGYALDAIDAGGSGKPGATRLVDFAARREGGEFSELRAAGELVALTIFAREA
jgi:hypothetical protein